MYETTFGVVAPMFMDLYTNTLTTQKGEILVRIGSTRKFFDNGQLAWELNYNEDGSVTKDDLPTYRKDGSIIIF